MYLFGRFSSGQILILVLFLFICPVTAQSQVYPYVNYSVRQGLINSNVYAMAQDKVGYIWLGTENGLSRFDGLNFKNYTLEQLGLKSYISSLTTTDEGTIVLGSGGSGIYSFNPVTEKLTPISKDPISRSNQLIIKDDLLISLHENRCFDFISIKTGESIFDDSVMAKNCTNKALSMVKLQNETILMGRSDGLYQLVDKKQIKLPIIGLENTSIYSIFEYNNSLIIGGDGYIFRIVNNHVVDTICKIKDDLKLVRNIKVDSRGNLWFNSWGSKDIYMISGKNILNVSETAGIINGTITGTLIESHGTMLVSVLGRGIYLFSNNHFLIYPVSEKLPNANIRKIVQTLKGGLLLGTVNGLAYLDPNEDKIISLKHPFATIQFVRDIILTPRNEYLVATINKNFSNSFSKAGEYTSEKLKIRYSHCSSLWADSFSVLSGNWDNKIIQYKFTDYSYIKSKENIFHSQYNTHRINCMQKDSFGRLWIGSQKGLCIINNEGEKYFPKSLCQEEEILKIIAIQNANLLVVSSGGFYLFKNNIDLDLIAEFSRNSIPGTNCLSITGQNEYLVGTSNGLFFIKDAKKSLMTIHDGILSDNVNDIIYDSCSAIAWIATSEGLMQVNLQLLRNENTEPLEIQQLLIVQDHKTWLPLENNFFNYNANSFSIKFQAFHYDNPLKIKYQYTIDDGKWMPAPSNEIQFASMDDGDHKIIFRAGLSENNWGPPKIVNISILPPFYRTWWFYTLEALTGLLLVLLFIRQQMKSLRLKQEEKTKTQQKIVELQQKALASNLNPHFVFNSLNAIQHFINTKNPNEANAYLTKFARLMRMHLNMAEKSSILLFEEIQRLEFYLGLEQMRFEDKMKWSITIDPRIDTYNLEIPNMIIQPFVENAIWHGIMPSLTKGFISLVLVPDTQGGLVIIITDNGVGFNFQPKTPDMGHESKGTRLIRERLFLLDDTTSQVLQFEHLSPGTRVRITLTSKMLRKTTPKTGVYQN